MLQGDGKQFFSSDVNIQIGANRILKYVFRYLIWAKSKVQVSQSHGVVDQIHNKDIMCGVGSSKYYCVELQP